MQEQPYIMKDRELKMNSDLLSCKVEIHKGRLIILIML